VAAAVAREGRANPVLLNLLVRQKPDKVKGKAPSVADFKTLMDVFVQETVRWMVTTQFPAMAKNFRGEESPVFVASSGREVHIAVGRDETETAECLRRAMEGHADAAARLAAIVHR